MDKYITINGTFYQQVDEAIPTACKAPSKPLTLSGAFEIPRDNYRVGKTEGSGTETYIKEVIYSNPATIILWSDGTKTVTKCAEGDDYNAETGLSICILKKLIGGTKLHDIFEDWLPVEGNRVALKNVREKHR